MVVNSKQPGSQGKEVDETPTAANFSIDVSSTEKERRWQEMEEGGRKSKQRPLMNLWRHIACARKLLVAVISGLLL